MTVPSVTFSTGGAIPVVGAGTWNIDGDAVRDTVHTALDAGYTHVDTAEGCANETEIGDVLADVEREDVFLTSKVLPSNLDYESVFDACEASLSRLRMDYLDLYLVHWPNPAISLRETLHALEQLYDQKKSPQHRRL